MVGQALEVISHLVADTRDVMGGVYQLFTKLHTRC